MLYTFGNQTGPIALSELDWNFAQIPNQANVANTVLNPAQANITTLGQLTALSVAGNILSNGAISTASTLTSSGNLTTSANLNAINMFIDNHGKTSAIITGNLLVQGTTTSINSNSITTGNLTITVGNNLASTNLTGAGIVAGLYQTGTLLYNYGTNSWQSNIGLTPTSNIAGLNLGATNNYWNTVYAQSVMLSGNLRAGNVISNNYQATNITATGNVTVGGNLSVTGAVNLAGNVTSSATVNVATVLTSSLSVAGTVTVNGLTASGNLYSAGLTTGNATMANVFTGNILNSGNVFTSGVSATGAIATSGAVLANSAVIASNLHVFGDTTINNNLNTGGEIGTTGNITATGNAFVSADAVYARTGNVYAGAYFIGNGSQLSNVAAANIRNASGWSVTPVGSKLLFYYGPSAVGSLDSSGNFTVTGNVTAFGTP
jgi:trimeric autotransporter adhesin